MSWVDLDSPEQIDHIIELSFTSPVLIFKHSTTCNISQMAKMRLESQWHFPIPSYYLDLKAHRQISNSIADRFAVHHESPQVLIIKEGECIYDASHFDIQATEINEVCNL